MYSRQALRGRMAAIGQGFTISSRFQDAQLSKPTKVFMAAAGLMALALAGCPHAMDASNRGSIEPACMLKARHTVELRQDLSAMLALLDEGDYDRFLHGFMDPRVVERLDGVTPGGFRAQFAESTLAGELHAAIRAALSAEPRFGKDAGLATFDQPEDGRRLLLRRMDGRWRVLD